MDMNYLLVVTVVLRTQKILTNKVRCVVQIHSRCDTHRNRSEYEPHIYYISTLKSLCSCFGTRESRDIIVRMPMYWYTGYVQDYLGILDPSRP